MNYRVDAHRKRKRVIKLPTSILRLLGFVLGPLIVALGVWTATGDPHDHAGQVFATAITIAVGLATLVMLVRANPKRRLVLDEESNIARLESRTFGFWRPTWSMALDEVRRVRVDTRDVTLDTTTDGQLELVRDALTSDEVAREATELLERDE